MFVSGNFSTHPGLLALVYMMPCYKGIGQQQNPDVSKISNVSKAGLGPVRRAHSQKLPVIRTSKTKPSPAHGHEKAKRSLISPFDRQDARRKKSRGVASLAPLSKEEEDWQLARTFHSIFFYTLHTEKKKEESGP